MSGSGFSVGTRVPPEFLLTVRSLVKKGNEIQRCWRLYEFCRASNGPDLLMRTVWSTTVVSGALGRLAYASSIRREQHCKWIVYGTFGWFRMRRLHAHAPQVAPAGPFLGTLSESLVSWHSS
jgi:hypothetical protein